MRSFAVLFVALLCACSSGGGGPTGSGNPAPATQTLTLAVGEIGTLPGTPITLAFHEVTEDSRCPANAVCVWEGNAQVALTLASPAGRLDDRLNTRTEPTRIAFGGVSVALVSLVPYPMGDEIDPETYVATFEADAD